VLLGLQMSGHLIIETLVERLLNTTHFGSATDIVLSGSSAGGIGTFHHTDWLADLMTAHARAKNQASPRVVGFPIEGMFFPEKWPVLREAFALGNKAPVANFMSQYLALLQHPWFPPACVEASKKEGFALGDCFDVSRMIYYTKTPLFIGMNRFDALLIQDLGVCLTCKANDKPRSGNGRFTRFYGARMNQTVIDVNRTLPQTGWFVPSEFHHDENFYAFLESKEKSIEGMSLRAAVEAWYYDRRPVVLVEATCDEDGPCVPPSACKNVSGNYTDTKWGSNLTMMQTGCDLIVNYGGKALAGNVLSDTVTVATSLQWSQTGSGAIHKSGAIKFADGGHWIRQDPSSHCHAVGGRYTDVKRMQNVSVVQSECEIVVDIVTNVGRQSLSGSIIGKTVTVATFYGAGNIQGDGSIAFADGGFWMRQDTQSESMLVV